jgi:hypothetical protein
MFNLELTIEAMFLKSIVEIFYLPKATTTEGSAKLLIIVCIDVVDCL